MANAALPADSRQQMTWATVDLLEVCLACAVDGGLDIDRRAAVEAFIDSLAALLPPREVKP
jgi:hypothetical protein